MTTTRSLQLLPIVFLGLALTSTSCSEGSGERAGKKLDNAAETVEEKTEEAWDKTKEVADDAAEKAKEAAEKVKDSVKPDEPPKQ
jgi:ElaB/YqjD/DUF883 family membrane-anchored ribosome-binding protein